MASFPGPCAPVEGPFVIRGDEVVSDDGEIVFPQVPPDVTYAPAHGLRVGLVVIAHVGTEDGVGLRRQFPSDQAFPSRFLEEGRHLLALEPVFADEQVNVIGQHRAGVAGEPLSPNHLADRLREGLTLGVAKPQHFMCKIRPRPAVVGAKLLQRRLFALPPEMRLRQPRQLGRIGFQRQAPPRVVGQPVPVSRQNQMMRDHHVLFVPRTARSAALPFGAVRFPATFFDTAFRSSPPSPRGRTSVSPVRARRRPAGGEGPGPPQAS